MKNNKKGTPLWKALLFERRLPWRYKERLNVLLLSFYLIAFKIKFKLNSNSNRIKDTSIKARMLNQFDFIISNKSNNGTINVALSELDKLKRKGINVKLYGRYEMGVRNIESLPSTVHKLGKNKNLMYISNFILKNKDANIFHGHNVTELPLFIPEKSIYHIHSDYRTNMPLYNKFKNKYKKAYYIFVSKYLMKRFLKRYPEIPKKCCFHLPNEIDIIKIKDYSKKNKKIKIFFASNWSKEKGIYILLDAIKYLEQKRKDFELILAGSPYLWANNSNSKKNVIKELEDPKIVKKSDLFRKIKELKNVKIIGELSHNKLLKTYSQMDVFVFSSQFKEGFPLSCLEAHAAGLPVVAFDSGGVPEIVQNEKTGILIRKSKDYNKNVKNLAIQIEKLINNPNLRKSMGKAGRKRVEKNFTWEKHIDKLIRIYEEIIRNNQSKK